MRGPGLLGRGIRVQRGQGHGSRGRGEYLQVLRVSFMGEGQERVLAR